MYLFWKCTYVFIFYNEFAPFTWKVHSIFYVFVFCKFRAFHAPLFIILLFQYHIRHLCIFLLFLTLLISNKLFCERMIMNCTSLLFKFYTVTVLRIFIKRIFPLHIFLHQVYIVLWWLVWRWLNVKGVLFRLASPLIIHNE